MLGYWLQACGYVLAAAKREARFSNMANYVEVSQ
jgi:hypothetical protein